MQCRNNNLAPVKSYLMASVLLISFAACSDTPSPAVTDNGGGGERTERQEPATPGEDTIMAMAVKYEGRQGVRAKCDLYIGVDEHKDWHGHDHKGSDHHILVKVDYSTRDGHKPSATESEFYQYNLNTGTFVDESQASSETSLVLMAAKLKDENAQVDVNQLDNYIANVELDQYIRVDFAAGTDAHDFTHELEEALEATGSVDLTDLNIIEGVQMALLHSDHYHEPACTRFNAVGVEETKFEMDGHSHEHK